VPSVLSCIFCMPVFHCSISVLWFFQQAQAFSDIELMQVEKIIWNISSEFSLVYLKFPCMGRGEVVV
jgi:hypothetical protein